MGAAAGRLRIWANPYFASVNNAKLIANAAALTAIFAAGVAVGIICGALDLSIPGVAAVAACTCGWLLAARRTRSGWACSPGWRSGWSVGLAQRA